MAKQFFTNGTGSQQTLTGSQDEKVAVYQTVADAEADLANLEAGQIVATPDTGDELAQPVDEVTSGNMHAVTSNAVDNIVGRINNNGKININLQGTVWLKIGILPRLVSGDVFELECVNLYNTGGSTSKKITIMQGASNPNSPNFYVEEKTAGYLTLFKTLRISYNNNWNDGVGVYLKYEPSTTVTNPFSFMYKFLGNLDFISAFTISAQAPTEYQYYVDFDLHSNGLYVNGADKLDRNGLTTISFSKEVNNANPNVILLFNITDWYNASTNSKSVGFEGVLFKRRLDPNGGYQTNDLFSIMARVSWGRGSYVINQDSQYQGVWDLRLCQLSIYSGRNDRLCIIKDGNNKYYIGLIANGYDVDYTFLGHSSDDFIGTRLNCTSSSEDSLPSGYSYIYKSSIMSVAVEIH